MLCENSSLYMSLRTNWFDREAGDAFRLISCHLLIAAGRNKCEPCAGAKSCVSKWSVPTRNVYFTLLSHVDTLSIDNNFDWNYPISDSFLKLEQWQSYLLVQIKRSISHLRLSMNTGITHNDPHNCFNSTSPPPTGLEKKICSIEQQCFINLFSVG